MCKYLSELVGLPRDGLPSGGWVEGSDEEDYESSDSLSSILLIKPLLKDVLSPTVCKSGTATLTGFFFGL